MDDLEKGQTRTHQRQQDLDLLRRLLPSMAEGMSSVTHDAASAAILADQISRILILEDPVTDPIGILFSPVEMDALHAGILVKNCAHKARILIGNIDPNIFSSSRTRKYT